MVFDDIKAQVARLGKPLPALGTNTDTDGEQILVEEGVSEECGEFFRITAFQK